MRKILLRALALLLFLSLLSACAMKEPLADDFDYSLSPDISLEERDHTHMLTFVPERAASCYQAGNLPYFICSCGKYFSDAAGVNEIGNPEALTLPVIAEHSTKYVFDVDSHQMVVTCPHTDITFMKVPHDNEYGAACAVCGFPGVTDGLSYTATEDGEGYLVSGMGTATATSVVVDSKHKGKPVIGVAASAFRDCTEMTSITLPNTITEIGENAFFGCLALTSIEIPEGVFEIGDHAFENCKSLSSISFPSSLLRIGDFCFFGASLLKDVHFSAEGSLAHIGASAFGECVGILSVTLPESVTEIGASCFKRCENLESVEFLGDVKSVASSAFACCKRLVSVKLPAALETIEMSAFQSCESLRSITLPNTLVAVEPYAFSNCVTLYSLNFSYNIRTIGAFAFQGCVSLSYVRFSNGVEDVGEGAFSGCIRIATVSLPKSLTSLSATAFTACKGLTRIEYAGTRDAFVDLLEGDKQELPCTVFCSDGDLVK